MWAWRCSGIVTPIVTGLLLGIEAVGGLLAGIIISGQLLAVFLNNSGGAWDNAKKLIEDEPKNPAKNTGKGSERHKAGVVGDTVGDPFKDTAGPALNPMIKVVNLVSVIVAPIIVQYEGVTGTPLLHRLGGVPGADRRAGLGRDEVQGAGEEHDGDARTSPQTRTQPTLPMATSGVCLIGPSERQTSEISDEGIASTRNTAHSVRGRSLPSASVRSLRWSSTWPARWISGTSTSSIHRPEGALRGMNFYTAYGDGAPSVLVLSVGGMVLHSAGCLSGYSTAKILYTAITLASAGLVVNVLGSHFNPRLSLACSSSLAAMSLLMSTLLFIAGQMDFILLAVITAVIVLLAGKKKPLVAGLLLPGPAI